MIKVKKDWYKTFYDSFLVADHLDSKGAHKRANYEIDKLINVLKIKKHHKILDVACGAGRHSIALAKKGYSVTGIDISSASLKAANNNITKSLKNKVKFEKANMIALKKYHGQFDIVLSIFTSIGYMPTEKDNEKVIKELAASLKPNGKLCIVRLANKDVISKRTNPRIWFDNKKAYFLEHFEFDKKTNYGSMEWTFIPKGTGRIKKYQYRVRFYNKEDIIKLFKKHKLANIKTFGSIDGDRYITGKSTHPVYIAAKKQVKV